MEPLSPQWPAGEQPWGLTVLLICLGWQGEVSFLQVFVSLGIPLCLASDKEMMVHLTIEASLPAASVFISTDSITGE